MRVLAVKVFLSYNACCTGWHVDNIVSQNNRLVSEQAVPSDNSKNYIAWQCHFFKLWVLTKSNKWSGFM